MIMHERVAAVVEELKRLKREGVTAVSVSGEAIARLRAAVAPARANDGRSTPGAATAARPDAAKGRTERAEDAAATPASGKPAGFTNLLDVVQAPAATAPRTRVGAVTSSARRAVGPLPPPPVIELPEGTKRERWEWLRRRVLECPVCNEHTHGDYKVVFGVGNLDADIFFCGEAPGGEEEIQGEPFVGPAGQLLTRMIIAMGLRREDVYIGNILNWRPEMEGRRSGRTVHQTGNRPPTEEEMRFCLPYLRAQLAVVQPKVIVALGSTAAQGLLGFGSFRSLGSIRGRWLEYQGTPLMVTYHPSYLLRYADTKTKRTVWEDLLKVMEKVGLPISDKQRAYFT